MTQGQQEEYIPRRCPRCGGLMAKPAGSQLYWHSDYDHPRCEITNLVDPPLAVQTPDEPAKDEPTRGKRQKK